MPHLAILGLGRMGTAMARRFSAQGHALTGWTRSGRSPDGIATATFEDAVARADTIVTSLYDDTAVAETLDRLATLDLTGKLIVETSTVRPQVLRSRLDALQAAGASAVDAPISGGPELVEAGHCGIFIGGTDADAARAIETLTSLTDRIFHTGPLGTGMAMKTVNNAMIQAYFAGLAELLPLARESGLDFETAIRILATGPAGMPLLKDRLPKALGEDDTVGFSLADVMKDNAVFRAALTDAGLPTPLLDRFAMLAGEATEAGAGPNDVAAFVPFAYDRR
ncbi:NAD(P)-dependent oxidoreductase [Roseobacter sp. HKCCA0434]|uniref:NAD(P)-dependent oxidoreductase n=1 Tax=Roseobacter sp. HKCCA0434 TaxID=3079297 RepID=UPI00290588B2|nr:NAD(P)-dependent oxidoreductase [Roseobacter sp. HKCCA0434]